MLTRRHFIATGAAATAATPALAHYSYEIPEDYLPKFVTLPFDLPLGSIHVEPDLFKLYLTTSPARKKGDQMVTRAIQYTVGVGRGSLYHTGMYTVGEKREWPDWRPTKEMMRRNPNYLQYANGVPGGPGNPLGIMALYLFNAEGKDTALRIHGTPQPWTIGQAVSNGCARLVNDHAIRLFNQVQVGASVTLHRKGRVVAGVQSDLTETPDYSVHY